MNQKAALEAAFCFAAKKKPTAQAVGKDNSGWMFTDSERVCRPVGKKQRSRREASESVHLIELNERKLVVTDGLGNKLFHH
ncbi:hypothetical protein JZM63_13010 [Aeromonas caviae]|nr:hypothetical protein JZM63_13010 [Aeromonas caviae]